MLKVALPTKAVVKEYNDVTSEWDKSEFVLQCFIEKGRENTYVAYIQNADTGLWYRHSTEGPIGD